LALRIRRGPRNAAGAAQRRRVAVRGAQRRGAPRAGGVRRGAALLPRPRSPSERQHGHAPRAPASRRRDDREPRKPGRLRRAPPLGDPATDSAAAFRRKAQPPTPLGLSDATAQDAQPAASAHMQQLWSKYSITMLSMGQFLERM